MKNLAAKSRICKLFSPILVFTLLIGVLSGCAGQTSQASNATPANSTAGNTSVTTSSSNAQGTDAGAGTYKIGFVMKSLSNPFFITMEDAAKDKASELGVELISLAPEKETDVEKQMQIVENLIAQKVDALCLVPNGSKELVPAIKKANDAGIPVFILDTKVDQETLDAAGAHIETFIGSDNYLGGQIAAEELHKALNGQGQVVVIEGIGGHETSEARVGGFKDKMAELGGIEIVASQPANWEQEQGYTVMQNMLQANPNVVGVFGANDLMALGAVKAIEDANKLDNIKVVGFDATDDAKVAIKEGKMMGSIAQYPDIMGAVGVESALKVLGGGVVESVVPVEVGMISAANVQ